MTTLAAIKVSALAQHIMARAAEIEATCAGPTCQRNTFPTMARREAAGVKIKAALAEADQLFIRQALERELQARGYGQPKPPAKRPHDRRPIYTGSPWIGKAAS